ncbi:MAG: tetratricopeptide repeat protein, partial [Methylothermaceae bacterium]|nr:tetratricopeptide repeat protein [Methylothermaceae bacterium]
LAQIHIEQEDWSRAITALNKALTKGKLDSPGQAWLLLGSAHFEQDALDKARSAFVKASQHSLTRKSATQWLIYLERLQTAP